jgi:2-polyprenyl-6-hydroxyphenyl methylase/3-demethylubiquinone-9 3-methyltransferase
MFASISLFILGIYIFFVSKESDIDINKMYDDHELSKTWNVSNGWSRGLHFINEGRISRISEIINNKNFEILDAGCGGGLISNKLAEMGHHNIEAFDLSRRSVLHAKENDKTKTVKYFQSSIYDLEKHDKTYDVVLLIDILDHLDDIGKAIEICNRLLKPEGILIYETIDKSPLSYLLLILIGENFGYIPSGTHDYNKFVNFDVLDYILKKNQFENKEVGWLYPSFYGKNPTFYFNLKNSFMYLGFAIKKK